MTFRVHENVAAAALDPSLPPTLFVVVGDHTPPFATRRKQGLFVPERVPYVVLAPRWGALP